MPVASRTQLTQIPEHSAGDFITSSLFTSVPTNADIRSLMRLLCILMADS